MAVVMQDKFGDPIHVKNVIINEVELVCTERAWRGGQDSMARMVLTPKKARKLARQLKRAARVAEASC